MRLPKVLQIDEQELGIPRRGNDVVLRQAPKSLAAAFDLLAAMPDDLMAEGRQDTPPQAREGS
jgi:antitoxin VapB